jgi:gamma-glutamylcyclotransferase (GGCT)/AIG2-like uncharacterized protein YtfP
MKQKLFVYGTLKDRNVQKEIIGQVVDGVPDILGGFSRSQVVIEGETYPIIIPHSGSSIKGLVLFVTSEELKQIDVYETDVYRREKVRLKSGKIVWVYQK